MGEIYKDSRKRKKDGRAGNLGNPALVKGVVLNPKGRPKGSVNKNTLLARAMMSDRGVEVVQKVIDMAMEGDVHCLKMCIDRILPVHKAVDPNRTKTDANIVINVGASSDIKEKIANSDPAKLVNPKTKTDDEIIIAVGEVIE
jgi:hypothetical protein